MASSAGKASVAAPALRTVLRGKGFFMSLLCSENSTLDALVQQGPEAISLGLGSGDDSFDFTTFSKGKIGACAIDEKLAG